MTADREALRARVFLRAVLPLVEIVAEAQPGLFPGTARVRLGVRGDRERSALLDVRDGAVRVLPDDGGEVALAIEFPRVGSLNAFFATGRARFWLRGALRHPIVTVRTLRLLASLRVLEPGPTRGDPKLRVTLLLVLVSRALAELHRGGHDETSGLVEESPDRVYQWSVVKEGIGAWLRMERGRVRAGRGTYAVRRPFVHFVFADVGAALAVLTETGSQMTGVRGGLLRTIGSPEYTRKIALLMQKVDELLQEG